MKINPNLSPAQSSLQSFRILYSDLTEGHLYTDDPQTPKTHVPHASLPFHFEAIPISKKETTIYPEAKTEIQESILYILSIFLSLLTYGPLLILLPI